MKPRFRVLVLFAVLILGVCGTSLAQEEGVGAAAFLRRGIDARALAMGGAFVAVADGYSSVYWNPAGLARVPTAQVGGMYTDIYGAGLGLNYLGGKIDWNLQPTQTSSSRLEGKIDWALQPIQTNSFRLGIGGAYTEFATEVRAGDEYGNPIGVIRYSERLFSGGGALLIPNLGCVGAIAKVYSFLAPRAGVGGADGTAFGIGFDVGLVAPVWDDFWFGVAASDIGNTKIKWHNTPTEPTDVVLARYTVGTAFVGRGFTLAADYAFQPKADNIVHVGGEYTLGFLSLRAGVVKRLGGPLSLAAGVGVNVKNLRIDAAWLQNKEIQGEGAHDTIVLSAEFTFGSSVPDQE